MDFNISDTVNELLTLAGAENQARASELLSDISTNYTSLETQLGENAKTIEKLTRDNEELVKVNGRLFLKQGIPGNTTEPQTAPGSDEPEIPELDYKDLFDEKGELKR